MLHLKTSTRMQLTIIKCLVSEVDKSHPEAA